MRLLYLLNVLLRVPHAVHIKLDQVLQKRAEFVPALAGTHDVRKLH